jgi:hypothetical protein
MDFYLKIKDREHSPRIPLPYKEIGNFAYGLLYLTVTVFIITIIINLIIPMGKPRESINEKE